MILGMLLLIIAVTLYFTFKYFNQKSVLKTNVDTTQVTVNPPNVENSDKKPDMKFMLANIERQVDSILFSFGIKKDVQERIQNQTSCRHQKATIKMHNGF